MKSYKEKFTIWKGQIKVSAKVTNKLKSLLSGYSLLFINIKNRKGISHKNKTKKN